MDPTALAKTFKHAWVQVKEEGLVRFVGSRFDAWTNSVTGFGTSRDKTTFTKIGGFNRLTDQEISNLYHGDDTAARIVDLLPQEMLREPYTVDLGGDQDLNTKVADKLDALNARGKLLDGLRWGRAYGGSAIILGCDDGLPSYEPLQPERARDLEYLYTLDRRYLYPLSFYSQPGRSGEPELFEVTTQGYSGQRQIVHESRLILFGGSPTGLQEKQNNNGWDHSVLVRVYDALAAYNDVWQAIRILAVDSNQAVFKMAGLTEAMSEGAKEALEARIRLTDMYRSVLRAVIVDAGDDMNSNGESFERQSVSFADIPNLLDRFGVRVSAAAEVPVTLFLGRSPAGLNATGESDFRGFYDRVRSKQGNDLTPKIRRITEVYLRTKAGGSHRVNEVGKIEVPIKVSFPALWTEPPSVEAKRRVDIATADKTYIDAGVVLPEEVALTRFPEDGTFNDGALKIDRPTREVVLKEELEKLKDPPEEPEVPLVPPPPGTPTEPAPPPIPEPDDEAA